jgi:CRISPR system Cascade subunit CasA
VRARADVLRAVAAYDQSEADLRGEVARQYPTLSLSPGLIWAGGPVTVPFGLGLQMTSWDRNHAAIRAAEARRQPPPRRDHHRHCQRAGRHRNGSAGKPRLSHSARPCAQGEVPAAEAGAARAGQRLARGETGGWKLCCRRSPRWMRASPCWTPPRGQRADAALEDALRRPTSGPETRSTPSTSCRPSRTGDEVMKQVFVVAGSVLGGRGGRRCCCIRPPQGAKDADDAPKRKPPNPRRKMARCI